jgi:hypothetical protein
MSVKAKAAAKPEIVAAKVRTPAKARVVARLTSHPNNLENSLLLSSGFLS